MKVAIKLTGEHTLGHTGDVVEVSQPLAAKYKALGWAVDPEAELPEGPKPKPSMNTPEFKQLNKMLFDEADKKRRRKNKAE